MSQQVFFAARSGLLGYEVMYLDNAVVLVACGVYLLAMRVGPATPEPVAPAATPADGGGIVPP